MKVAFTTSGDDLDAPLDSRFGRAPRFLVYDMDHKAVELIDNAQSLNAAQGAGIQAAETVVRAGVGAVVTGHCGPKAFRALSAAGVAIYNCSATTVGQALSAFEEGTLAAATTPDVEGHWA
jgi:predicted Fe-Mo cluster-binding NifX family protein